MTSPVRFTSGVSTAAKGSALFNLPIQDPTKIHTYFDDFNKYVAADWTVTQVAGTGTVASVADDPFGSIVITNSAADNDATQIQLPIETFQPVAGKGTWFKTRLKVNDATESDFLVGLAVLDTSLLGATLGDGVTDGMFFYKDDGSTSIKFSCQKDATTGQTTPITVGTCTTSYITLGFEYDGVTEVKVFFNDVHVNTVNLTTTPSAYLPDTPVTVSVAITNGAAAAKTMTVDYLFAAQER